MDLRIMPVMEIIRHKTFAVARKTAKSATKVSWYTVKVEFSSYQIVTVHIRQFV